MGIIMYEKIKTQKDVDALRTKMARGNYPLSMTDCEVVGINGDCGLECPVFLREECPFPDEFEDRYGKEAMEKALNEPG